MPSDNDTPPDESASQSNQGTPNVPAVPKLKIPRRPRIDQFIRAVDREGPDSPRVIEMTTRMSSVQLAAIADHPNFQKLLDGYVFKHFILNTEISHSRWKALTFLQRGSGRAPYGKNTKESNINGRGMGKEPITVKSEDE